VCEEKIEGEGKGGVGIALWREILDIELAAAEADCARTCVSSAT